MIMRQVIQSCRILKTNKMTKDELASKLNGNNRREEISKQLEAIAKENSLLVLFGASDDCLEFRGAIYDETGAYNGTTVWLTKNGNIRRKAKKSRVKIKSIWCPDETYSWHIVPECDYTPFEIFEDGEPYCRGAVVDLKQVFKLPLQNNTNAQNIYKVFASVWYDPRRDVAAKKYMSEDKIVREITFSNGCPQNGFPTQEDADNWLLKNIENITGCSGFMVLPVYNQY